MNRCFLPRARLLLCLPLLAAPAVAQLAPNPAWSVTSGQAASGFGDVVTGAGDVNGDGYDDVVACAPSFSAGQGAEGRAFLYLGSRAGLGTTPAWTFETDQAFATIGDVAGAGDVDGDGFDDVVVGSRAYDGPQLNGGRAWLFRGSAAGLSLSPSWTVDGSLQSQLGSAVAGAGDINGDGFADILVGSAASATFYAFHGSPTGPSLLPDATISGPLNTSFAGALAGAGDVNADGYADVIVGASTYENGQDNEGFARVHLGSAAGLVTTAAWTVESDSINAQLGCSVDGAGDVNGDGFHDVIVGAWRQKQDGITYGDAFVYHGGPAGLALTPAWNPGPQQSGSDFGVSVAGAGDVNGDGYGDVIIGAASFYSSFQHDGRAYVHLGSASGLPAIADWTGTSHLLGDSHAYFGTAVGGAGDVNGDGFADVVAGGHNFDNGKQRAWLFHGCGGCAAAGYYHPGKPAPLFPRLLSTAPVLGGTATLTLRGGAPGVPAFLLVGLAPDAQPFDEGTLLVVPLLTQTLPPIPSGGTLPLPVAMPSAAALVGLDAYFQCLLVVPAASGPHHTVQTNGVHWTLGS